MALLFDIKRYCINDGPGIRITFFMKGCPLHCVWCHNPEGISPQPQKLYTRKKCIGCLTCVNNCPEKALEWSAQGIIGHPDRCIQCNRCTDECPTLALELSGRSYSIEQLVAEAEKERAVMEQSGGGVTLCGGEPLLHPTFLLELLQALGNNHFHRAVDTTLYAKQETVEQLLLHCELLLVDLKSMDSAVHQQYCGVPNELILSNLQYIATKGKPYQIRIPLIENVNADEANLTASARFLASLPTQPTEVNLLPYHNIGISKHDKLGTIYNPLHYPFGTPTEEKQQQCLALFNHYGLKATIGG